MIRASLQQFYSSFTVDAINPGEQQRRQLGVDKRISNPSKHRQTLRSGFLNRESEVRILPGALPKDLQTAGMRESPSAVPGLSDTTLTPPSLPKRGVHSSGGSVTHVWEHVAVDVEREGDIRMP
jgi:hypothetical protein